MNVFYVELIILIISALVRRRKIINIVLQVVTVKKSSLVINVRKFVRKQAIE